MTLPEPWEFNRDASFLRDVREGQLDSWKVQKLKG